jgi:hypothetical protein
MSRCTSTRADGSPCQAVAVPGRDQCAFHDPGIAGSRAEGRREGGRQRSRPRVTLPADHPDIDVRSVRDVCRVLSETMNQVRTGRLDPRVANTVGYLASVMVRALEAGDLEERLATLEAAVQSRPSLAAGPMDHEITLNGEPPCQA